MNIREANIPIERPSWDEYFIQLAYSTSQRGTCLRRKVGCVIVSCFNDILSGGYNGSPPGAKHCIDEGVGCQLQDVGAAGLHCVRTIHAETNAVARAARNGISLLGTTCYCTDMPCHNCIKTLCAAGITRVIYDRPYDSPLTVSFCFWNDIPLIQYKNLRVEPSDKEE